MRLNQSSLRHESTFTKWYKFRVVTENEIRTDRLYNVKFLSRYKCQKTDAYLLQLINGRYAQQSVLTPLQLTDDPSFELNDQLLYTLWQHRVCSGGNNFDLNKIWLPAGR